MRRHEGEGSGRLGATQALSGFLAPERSRIFDGATPERRRQLEAAERVREVYAAWNAVVAGTREGAHVTGLHYVPESNELVVYADGAAWAQELTMLREIVRARMAARGVDVSAIVCRASREGYRPAPSRAAKMPSRLPGAARAAAKTPVPRRALSPSEQEALDAAVAPIGDDKLRQALENAMKANFEWKKGLREAKRP